MKQSLLYWKTIVLVGALAAMVTGFVYADPLMPGRLIEIGNRHIHVVENMGVGPVVLLEAGGGGFSSFWLSVQPKIHEQLGLRVISYDRAGLGWSDPSPDTYSITRRADDLNALLNAIGTGEPVIIVGHSYGGWVTQAFAQRYPERIAGIVLVDVNTSYFFDQFPKRVARIESDGAKRPIKGVKRLKLRLQKRWLSKHLQGPANAFDPIVTDKHQQALGHALTSFGQTSRALRHAKLPHVPTVVISRGKQEKGFPWGSATAEAVWREGHKRLIGGHPCAEHWIARESGHAVVINQSGIVVKAIESVVSARDCTSGGVGA